MELVVEGPPEGAITVCVAVDGEAAVNECREGNNVHCLDLAGLCGAPEPPAIAISDVLVGEGDAGTVEAELTVALSAPAPLAVEVDYATADAPGVSATAGVDYQEIGGRLTIPEGGVAARLRVPVVVDVVDEGDELFAVVLADPVNAVLEDALGYGTIVDDDEALLAIDDVETEEGDAGTAPARFTIRLATVSDREIAVDYATVAETASAGEDFEPADGTLVFPPGTVAREVAVGVVGDLLLEPDETFRVELSGAVNTTMADPIGIGTIRDDEICAGPNLLVNPGAEARPDEGELPGWIEVAGSDWQRRSADPDPAEGGAYFFAGTAEYAELVQDVDVGAYAARIAAGEQIFEFSGAVRTADEASPDVARIVAEYRDLHNHLVLEAFDSGEILSYEWHPVSDVRVAPAGTGWIRLRLISTRFSEGANDGYFDALSLRSLRAPTVVIDDVLVYEGHSGLTDSVFTVDLACAYEHPISVDYHTADGTALAGEDYLVTAGTLDFPPGATTAPVTVPVLADAADEPDEVFLVELSPPLSAGEPVLLDPEGVGTIRNDDFCPRSHGYWKNHTELWPVDWLVLGGMEYDAAELYALLRYNGRDAASKLALQLVATRLNLVRGSDPRIDGLRSDNGPRTAPRQRLRPTAAGEKPRNVWVVAAADAFLELYPPGSDPRGETRQEANAIKDDLDEYNNSCPSGD